jgi:hypothetical protein
MKTLVLLAALSAASAVGCHALPTDDNSECVVYAGESLDYDAAKATSKENQGLGFTRNGTNGIALNQCAALARALIANSPYDTGAVSCACNDRYRTFYSVRSYQTEKHEACHYGPGRPFETPRCSCGYTGNTTSKVAEIVHEQDSPHFCHTIPERYKE